MPGIVSRGLGLSATCMWRNHATARAALLRGDVTTAAECARTLQQIADCAWHGGLRTRALDARKRITRQISLLHAPRKKGQTP